MARNIPRTLQELLGWASTHLPIWQAHQAEIGVSAGQIAGFAAQLSTLEATFAAAETARLASVTATRELNEATAALRGGGGAIVNTIKAYAGSTGDAEVYPLAGVDPGAAPGTAPVPEAPTNFSAAINSDGSLTIKWKARQPRGATLVQYRVLRRLVGLGWQTPFTLIDTVGSTKTYTDRTIPAGTQRIEYTVQPMRGDVVGPTGNTFVVQFGSGGVGGVGGVVGNMGLKAAA